MLATAISPNRLPVPLGATAAAASAAAPTLVAGSASAAGLIAGAACYWGANALKRRMKYDDSLDAFGIHGIGGIIGALGTGIVYAPSLGGPGAADYDMAAKMVVQAETVVTTIVVAAIGTAIAIYAARLVTGLRVSEEVEREGLDLGEHGERAYNY